MGRDVTGDGWAAVEVAPSRSPVVRASGVAADRLVLGVVAAGVAGAPNWPAPSAGRPKRPKKPPVVGAVSNRIVLGEVTADAAGAPKKPPMAAGRPKRLPPVARARETNKPPCALASTSYVSSYYTIFYCTSVPPARLLPRLLGGALTLEPTDGVPAGGVTWVDFVGSGQ